MMATEREIEAAAKAITEYYSSERADMTPSEYIAVMWQCYIPEAKAALEAAEKVREKK